MTDTVTSPRLVTRGFADLLVNFGAGRPSMSRSGDEWQRSAIAGLSGTAWTHEALSSERGSMAPLLVERRSTSWTVWLIGELFGYGDAVRERAFADWCGDLESGTPSPCKLNGHCLIVARDERDGSWHAWTNRFGTVHLYYGATAGRTVFGTFYPAVAAAVSTKSLDWQGLTGYFAFGFFPQDRTFFDDVRIVRPATHVVWDREGRLVSQSRYWNWEFNPARARSYNDTVEQFGETLTRILRDYTASGRLVLPISGGLDSRTIAAVISADGPPSNVWAYSYGYTNDSQETRIAARIAKARGIDFRAFTVSDYLFTSLDRILASVEGFQSVTSTRQAGVLDEIAPRGDYLLAGHWGDVWLDDSGLPPGSRELPDDVLVDHGLKKIQKPGGQWLMEHVCAGHLSGQPVHDLLRQTVVNELRRLEHIEDPDFRLKAFKTEQWSFRWTVPSLRMFQPAMFVRLPFYDNRMHDFCATVPPEFLRGRRLQLDYLKRFHRDLARVTWEETDSSLFNAPYYDSWLIPKRIVKKVARVALRKPHVGRNWMVQFLRPSGRAGLDTWLLRPGRRIHEFVRRQAIVDLVEGMFRAPDAANGYAVSQLLTLAVWMEENH